MKNIFLILIYVFSFNAASFSQTPCLTVDIKLFGDSVGSDITVKKRRVELEMIEYTIQYHNCGTSDFLVDKWAYITSEWGSVVARIYEVNGNQKCLIPYWGEIGFHSGFPGDDEERRYAIIHPNETKTYKEYSYFFLNWRPGKYEVQFDYVVNYEQYVKKMIGIDIPDNMNSESHHEIVIPCQTRYHIEVTL